MNFNIIPVKGFQSSFIEKEIRSLFNEQILNNDFFSSLSFCYKDPADKIVFLIKNNDQYTYLIDSGIKNCFSSILKYFVNKKDINLYFSFNVLLIAEKIGFEETEYFEIFKFLGWQHSKKGLDFFNIMKCFSENLKNKVFNKKISINEAVLFHSRFEKDYDKILDKIPEDMSFSNTNKIIKFITEYSKKEDKNLTDIISEINFSNEKTLIESAFAARYPKSDNADMKMKEFIGNIGLPKNSEIIYDKSFETEDYSLQLKFKNFDSLKEKISEIKKRLETVRDQNSFKDIFIHKNLFDQ
jgi:hypothetical protein